MMVSAPGRAFASWTAARRVHWPPALAQIPSPGEASTASIVLVTLNVAARARVAVTNRHTGPTRRRSSALTAPLLKMLRIILVVANGGVAPHSASLTSCVLGAPSGNRTRSRAFAGFARGADVQACNAATTSGDQRMRFSLDAGAVAEVQAARSRLGSRRSNVPRPHGSPRSGRRVSKFPGISVSRRVSRGLLALALPLLLEGASAAVTTSI